MNVMMCMAGEPEQLPFLPEIAALGAGIELGSYGLVGIQSDSLWQARVALHQAVRDEFQGRIAIHGPFIGMEWARLARPERCCVMDYRMWRRVME
jgi:hypothetical protein